MQLTLSSARIRAGKTKEAVAVTLGVHPQSLARWERDSSKASGGILKHLCEIYNINFADLFIGTQSEFDEQVLAQPIQPHTPFNQPGTQFVHTSPGSNPGTVNDFPVPGTNPGADLSFLHTEAPGQTSGAFSTKFSAPVETSESVHSYHIESDSDDTPGAEPSGLDITAPGNNEPQPTPNPKSETK